MHNIVIVGGNLAGVATAHYLLRHVLPKLNAFDSDKPTIKITLISPSDHTFFKIGAPRAFFSNTPSLSDKVFASIPDGFSQYKSSEFDFIQGEAVNVDEATETISVKIANSTALTSVQYDSLVVATGTTSSSPLWTLHGDHHQTKNAALDIHERLLKAKTILIAGGGAAGVETAGEIAAQHNKKDITILSGGTQLLSRLKNKNAGKTAEKRLEALGVRTIHNIKVIKSTRLSTGTTTVELSDGSTQTFDIYIETTGGKPNTSFLPPSWLDNTKRVDTDMGTLRAIKAPAGVYSIGDVASYSIGSILDAEWPVPALGYSIWSDLRGKIDGGEQGLLVNKGSLTEKKYKQMEKDMQVVPIGPNGGVGVIFGWQIPNFFVWLIKSRTFFMEKAPGKATGAEFLKP